MPAAEPIPTPSSHTAQGGVLLGTDRAGHRLVLFEDPQCPYCRQFEEISGELLRSARDEGNVAIEYRMRCFLGVESVRADNALALAAEANRFDELRTAVFASLGDLSTADAKMAGLAGRQAVTVTENINALIQGESDLAKYESMGVGIALPIGPEGGAGQFPGQDGIVPREVIAEVKGRDMMVDRFSELFGLAAEAAD